MTNTETTPGVQATFFNPDAIYDEVESVVDVLPNELDVVWLNGICDDPDELILRLGFWEAARDVIKAMLRAGYTRTPPKG